MSISSKFSISFSELCEIEKNQDFVPNTNNYDQMYQQICFVRIFLVQFGKWLFGKLQFQVFQGHICLNSTSSDSFERVLVSFHMAPSTVLSATLWGDVHFQIATCSSVKAERNRSDHWIPRECEGLGIFYADTCCSTTCIQCASARNGRQSAVRLDDVLLLEGHAMMFPLKMSSPFAGKSFGIICKQSILILWKNLEHSLECY